MREKKEFHRYNMPHYQKPGQAYFITWSLKDAIPAKAFEVYRLQLAQLKKQINEEKTRHSNESLIRNLEQQYQSHRKKYIKAYNDLLDAERHPSINLSRSEYTQLITNALQFWEGKKIHSLAFAIMSNHVHWVFETFEKDPEGQPVYVEDIMQSVKRYTANQINKLENRQGPLWQMESFDTTIRDDKHMYNAIRYTLHNPVAAGLVSHWKLWPGCYDGTGNFE
ncbi:MAG TPA: hypothetical protein VK205_00550 [Prolixibacteraceae bacterium]|nr:hypothetical protein [Prolixibacteraceae bacterium]